MFTITKLSVNAVCVAPTEQCYLHIIMFITFLTQDKTCVARQLLANSLLYIAINFAGMYTKYLTDRGQRLAFIETHKAMEHKKDSEKECQRTQKLLDSSKVYSVVLCVTICFMGDLIVNGVIPFIFGAT